MSLSFSFIHSITFALAKEIRNISNSCENNQEVNIQSLSQKAINNSSMGNLANSGEFDIENLYIKSIIFNMKESFVSTVNMPYLLLYTLCVYLSDLL